MLSAGLPELNTTQDIEYFKKQLALDKTEQEATAIFKWEIK